MSSSSPRSSGTAKSAPPAAGRGGAGEAQWDFVPSSTTGYAGLIVLGAGIAVMRLWPAPFRLLSEPLILVGAMAGSMIAYELIFTRITRRAAQSGVDWSRSPESSLPRVATKLVGLGGCVALVGLLYFIFSEYHGSFYAPFFGALAQLWIPFAALAGIYVLLVDPRMPDPHDGYWHLGRLLLLRRDQREPGQSRALLLGWIIKGFYLPLMFVWFSGDVAHALAMELRPQSFFQLCTILSHFIFTTDLAFACVGYTLTLRLFDSHIRSPQPTALGWAVTLACYPPFWTLLHQQYLAYGDEHTWVTLTDGTPWIQVPLGLLIIASLTLYTWSTVVFGLRFSNLTHRGIIRHGSYRWLKHPAYVGKNLSYWLIEPPLWGASVGRALQSSGRLLIINLIYYLRALTEEQHLGADPTYQEYRRFIAEHGLWARLRPRA